MSDQAVLGPALQPDLAETAGITFYCHNFMDVFITNTAIRRVQSCLVIDNRQGSRVRQIYCTGDCAESS